MISPLSPLSPLSTLSTLRPLLTLLTLLTLRPLLTLLTLLTLTACSVGPNYHRPSVPVPTHWSEPLSGGETNGIPALAQWWKSFADSELDSLIQRAVQANLQLRIAEARVREARAQRVLATAGWWPTLNASSSYTRNRISQHYFLPLPPGTPLNYNWYQAGFDASWELDIFGGTRRSVEAASADLAAVEFNRRDVLVTLTSELARDYFEARGFQQQIAITRQNIQAQSDLLGLTRDRYRAGLTSQLDVEQSAALLATTEAEVPSLQAGFEAAVHRLGVLLAEPPGALDTELSRPAAVPPPPPVVPVGLPSDLLLRRPDIQSAERQLAAATARIGVAKADLFPRFSLTGNGGLQSVSVGNWFSPGSRFWTFGPTVTWRIFDAGRIRANIRIQDARQEQALATYEQTVLSAFEDVENALSAYAKEQLRFVSLQTAVQAQTAAVRLSQDIYTHGLADFTRVLESQRSLYVTQDQLVQSQKTVSEDLVAIYKALGGGWGSESPSP